MSSLKDRISGAEQATVTEESPLAAIFRNARPMGCADTPQPEQSIQGPQLRELPADILDEMEQPFHLYSAEKLEEMRDSITKHGIIQRIIVRPRPDAPGRYQIISGRNRRRAAIMAGYTMVPCEIRSLDDDEARLQMVETNLQQREELLPSEKAWAYRIRLEALVHQGKRTSPQIAAKLRSDDEIGKESGESGDTVRRYIRLTYLLPALLDAVDGGELSFTAGVTLSYLDAGGQDAVYQYFFVEHKQNISGALADSLRAIGERETITEERIQKLLHTPAGKPKQLRKVSVPMKPLRKFFPSSATQKEVEDKIIEIVTAYFQGQLN